MDYEILFHLYLFFPSLNSIKNIVIPKFQKMFEDLYLHAILKRNYKIKFI